MQRQRIFLVWFGIFLVWSAYRAYFHFSEWVDELVVKPMVFILPVIYLTVIRRKESLASLGLLPSSRSVFLDAYIGVTIGVIFAFEGVVANYMKYSGVSFAPIRPFQTSTGVLPFLILMLSSAISEEILGRGYLYQQLLRVTKKQHHAAALSSFLFLLLHIPLLLTRLHVTGSALVIYPVSVFLLSMVNCYLLSLRKSLTLPILIHVFWNMTLTLYV